MDSQQSDHDFHSRATRGFAWNYFYKITEFGLVNLFTVLVVRHFGPAISSPYAVFTAICTSGALLASFGVDGVLLRYIQRVVNNKHSNSNNLGDIESFSVPVFLKTLLSFRLVIAFFVSSLVILLCYAVPLLFDSTEIFFTQIRSYLPSLILYLFCQSIVAFCTFSLIGLLETKGMFIASLLARTTLLTGGIILVTSSDASLWNAIILYVTSTAMYSAILLFVLFREMKKYEVKHTTSWLQRVKPIITLCGDLLRHPKKIHLFMITPIMIYGITTWGSDILSNILGRQPDVLMMRGILGETSEIGYYVAASMILLVTEYIFLFGLGGTLVSIFSKLSADDTAEYRGSKYPRLTKARLEISGFQNVVLIPLCAFMMGFADDVVGAIYGAQFSSSVPMVRVGLIALVLSVGVFGGGMQITTLVAIGKERIVFKNRLVWCLINLVANFFLIKYLGGMGALIGTQFSNAFACATEGFFAYKFVGKSMLPLNTLRILLISALSTAIAYAILQTTFHSPTPLIASVVGVGISSMVTVLAYIILRVPEALRIWQRIKSLLHREPLLNIG
ncbi:MAG: polysaccharide biosynthesis C-terminal domain-containing protein [bacterium]